MDLQMNKNIEKIKIPKNAIEHYLCGRYDQLKISTLAAYAQYLEIMGGRAIYCDYVKYSISYHANSKISIERPKIKKFYGTEINFALDMGATCELSNIFVLAPCNLPSIKTEKILRNKFRQYRQSNRQHIVFDINH